MKVLFPIVSVVLALVPLGAGAQYKEKEMVDPGGSNKVVDRTDRTAVLAGEAGSETLVLTLEDALKIALSENVSVKVADKEVERVKYARKGTYASLFPQIDGSASYQRTIKKQVMYMDFDMGNLTGMRRRPVMAPELHPAPPAVRPARARVLRREGPRAAASRWAGGTRSRPACRLRCRW